MSVNVEVVSDSEKSGGGEIEGLVGRIRSSGTAGEEVIKGISFVILEIFVFTLEEGTPGLVLLPELYI